MFTKITLATCLIGLVYCQGLHNYAIGGYAGHEGYAPDHLYYGDNYSGYGSGYTGYGTGYPGYRSSLRAGLTGGVATSYVNFNKYAAPRYNSNSGLNGLPYGSADLYGANNGLYGGYNSLKYNSYVADALGYGIYPGYGFGVSNNAYSNNI